MSADKAPTFEIPTPAQRRGPGRPKGATAAKTTATASNAEIKQAMATLESFYNIVATGLLLTGMHSTLAEWTTSAEQLKATNEDALKAAPKLAHWIANAGSTGGSATFVLTHGMAFAGIAGVARTELAARREALQEAARKSAQETNPDYVPGL